MPDDLIPLAVRIAVRNAVGGWGPYTVRAIDDLFQSHGFIDRDDGVPDAGGARRTTAEKYQVRVDFGSFKSTRRYLDLVDEVLEHYPEDAAEPAPDGNKLRRELARAKIVRGPQGRLELLGEEAQTHQRLDEAAVGLWIPERLRVFVSHTSAHKVAVGDLASDLNREAFSCFVAHDAIEPSRQWQDVIELALRTSDILVAYVTSDFTSSKWTDQEVGWALGREIPVIPVKVEADPYGFFGAYQAVPVREGQSGYETVTLLVRAIAVAVFSGQRPGAARLLARMTDLVVEAFCRSRSFDSTRRRYELLALVPASAWTSRHLERLEEAVVENRQIREASIGAPDPRDGPTVVAEMIARLRRSVGPAS
jgi:hypothetical protein